jgi:5-methylcytosine-specific restriction protein A
MPRRPLTVCLEPGCATLVARGRCPPHQRQRQRELDARRPQRARYPGNEALSWDTLRRRVRRRDGGQHCSRCGGTLDVDVHHADGDRTNSALNNLVQLCRRCHGRAHTKGKR